MGSPPTTHSHPITHTPLPPHRNIPRLIHGNNTLNITLTTNYVILKTFFNFNGISLSFKIVSEVAKVTLPRFLFSVF